MTTATAIAPAPAQVRTGLSFSVQQTELAQAIEMACRAVSSRPNQPVLANVMLTATEPERVEVSGLDLTKGIRSGFNARVTGSGCTTIPAELLNKIVSRLQGELLITQIGEQIKIQSETGEYYLSCLDADEFPSIPMAGSEAIGISTKWLLDGLRFTLPSTSADETKQVLTGAHIEMSTGKVTFASTDGHRMSMLEVQLEGDESPDDLPLAATIPAATLRDLQQMLGKFPAEEIQLYSDDQHGQVVFQWADQLLSSRTLGGQFPNFRQLIPKAFEGNVFCDRRALLDAVSRVSIMADQKNSVAKIDFTDGKRLKIDAEAQGVGSAFEEMDCTIKDEDSYKGQLIAFNVRYLLDALKQIDTLEVLVCFNSPTSPVVIKPVNGPDALCLVMPVQVRV